MENYIIGIDLGGTSAKIGVFNEQAELIDDWKVMTDKSDQGQKIIPNIISSIKIVLASKGLEKENIKGIGMGAPGLVNSKEGTCQGAYNLNWAEHQNLAATFNRAFPGVTYRLANDANCAMLGERWRGAGRGSDNMVMATLGTGVGGGLLAQGKLLQGSQGGAGEIGHLTVDPHGPLCTCGKRGCLEALASATGVHNLVEEYAGVYADQSSLAQAHLAGENISVKNLFDQAENRSDLLAIQVVRDFSKYLGLGLSHLVNTLDPEYLVLAGGLSQSGQFLINQLEPELRANIFSPLRDHVQIIIAELGDLAGLIGAASLIFDPSPLD